MNTMRFFLIIFVILAFNFLFADRYLIPKTPIPADQIIIKNSVDAVPQRILLDSKIYQKENQEFVITLNNQTRNNAISMGLKEVSSYKAVEMPNGNYELTDMKLLLQYKDASYVENIRFDYGLDIIDSMPVINVVILQARDVTQLNDLMINLTADSRVVDVSFNLVEMSEVPE